MCLCIVSTDGLWWSGAGDRIASVFECARRLHLCTCVVLGANDSWHLATISGSLISIERFGGGGEGWVDVQIPLYLTNRCVFDLQTRADAHTHKGSNRVNTSAGTCVSHLLQFCDLWKCL